MLGGRAAVNYELISERFNRMSCLIEESLTVIWRVPFQGNLT